MTQGLPCPHSGRSIIGLPCPHSGRSIIGLPCSHSGRSIIGLPCSHSSRSTIVSCLVLQVVCMYVDVHVCTCLACTYAGCFLKQDKDLHPQSGPTCVDELTGQDTWEPSGRRGRGWLTSS